jgi:hypothetical protein
MTYLKPRIEKLEASLKLVQGQAHGTKTDSGCRDQVHGNSESSSGAYEVDE